MRNIGRILLIVILIPIITPLLPQNAYAGDLDTLIRLDRLSISKASGGLICATPSTSGVENSLQVIFPTGFNVNSTASNWTVTTTNLPSGSTPLPGIGTATAVSGQTVTFPSNDLSTGTQYCFNFSSTNTLTTPSSTGTYTGILRTMNNSSVAIDYHAYALSIVTNDSISVTATVAANPTDFSADLALTDPANGTFQQGTTLTYTLTYGNLLPYPAAITVEANWDLGTIENSGSATEDILDYDVGSAANGFNNTAPVIDSINRKIDWYITTIPGNTTDQTVTFRLKTNSTYTDSLPVSFTVNGKVLGPGTQTADSTVTSTYQYIPITPTPTSGSSSGSSGSSGSSNSSNSSGSSNSTSATSKNNLISAIDLRTVSSSQAAVFVQTSLPTKIKLKYGTQINNISQSISSDTFSSSRLLTISNLRAHTRYYFKVIVTSDTGDSSTSDLYLLDTAISSSAPLINMNSLIVSSQDVLLVDSNDKNSNSNNFIIPNNSQYVFKFEIKDYANVKSVRAIVRSKKVLGVNSIDSSPEDSDSSGVTETSPGHYVGKLNANITTGEYELILQVQDFEGNISEQKIADFTIVNPLKIINKKTKEAIEKAKVTFYYYNSRLKIYELISSSINPIKNPAYSEANGNISTILPEGKYRAVVSVLGFKEKTIDFTLNTEKKMFYPTIEMESLPFNLITLSQSYYSTATDFFNSLNSLFRTLRDSYRFFNLLAFVLISFLVFLLTIALSKRLSVPIFLFPSFAIYHLVHSFKKSNHTFLVHGNVSVTGLDEPIADFLLYFISNTGKVIGHTKTNNYGEFLIKIHEAIDLRITGSKKGFKGISQKVKIGALNEQLLIKTEQTGKPPNYSISNIKWYAEYLLSTFFEAILIIVLVIEIIFMTQFGVLKVLPFLIISVIDILLWAANIRAARR